MSKPVKQLIACTTSALILFVAYYGSYLPLRKATVFINTIQNLDNSHTIADFEKTLSVPLDLPSPIGQEELVRNVGNIVLNFTQQPGNRPEDVEEMISYIEGYFKPIVDRGRGMSFGQDLYLLGAANEVAYLTTRREHFLASAETYYQKGYELGPKRPEILYGLFDVYRAENNAEKATAIGKQILEQWPSDDRVRKGLTEFLDKAQKLTK